MHFMLIPEINRQGGISLSMIPMLAYTASATYLTSQLASFYWPFRRGGNSRNGTEDNATPSLLFKHM